MSTYQWTEDERTIIARVCSVLCDAGLGAMRHTVEERMHNGKDDSRYGAWTIKGDPRDYMAEGDEEIIDGLDYYAAHMSRVKKPHIVKMGMLLIAMGCKLIKEA